MATEFDRLQNYLDYSLDEEKAWELRLGNSQSPLPPPIARGVSAEAIDERWKMLPVDERSRAELADEHTMQRAERYRRNIENFIGTVKVPVGVAGPLRVNGMFARGDYYIPLATTEAALVASYSRGAQVISRAGGCTTVLINEGVTRAPGFCFENLTDATNFTVWVMRHVKKLQEVASHTTRHGQLIDVQFNLEGNHVYFGFNFMTSDASGQNMATIASEAVCDYILQNAPVRPRAYVVESNLSGDKKATNRSFQSVRGRKVSAEAFIPRSLVEEALHTTPEEIERYSNFSTVGSLLSGSIGTQGHYANALAALYLACGQDVACVAESAVGITRLEATSDGNLHLCVTLPGLMLATVGGGTTAPSQAACLDILGLTGAGKAHAFAEVTAGLCLAGELSIAAAICSHEFVEAHRKLARRRKSGRS